VVEQCESGSRASAVRTGAPISLCHFDFLTVLGRGNFGKVMLAEARSSKNLYAIKILKKHFIVDEDAVQSMRSEKSVFLIANEESHPFLLNLHACFQSESRIFFVMEYVAGRRRRHEQLRVRVHTRRACVDASVQWYVKLVQAVVHGLTRVHSLIRSNARRVQRVLVFSWYGCGNAGARGELGRTFLAQPLSLD
jgi:serine/threonine protein kinase